MTDWVWVPFEVARQFDGYRVDRFLSQRLAAYSRSRVQRILDESRVMRQDRLIKASTRVYSGQHILIAYPRRMEQPLEERDSLPVLFEDDFYVALNKPANLLSHPTGKTVLRTVTGIFRHTRPEMKSIHLLHRLDRETSGVLVLGKSIQAARAWTQAMEKRRIKKEYIAIVRGAPRAKTGLIDRPIGRLGGEIHVQQAVDVPDGVPAITRYHVDAKGVNCALVRAYPQTGRLHQIRVHLASIGHPILGDALYNGDGSSFLKMTRNELAPQERSDLGFARLALHAAAIEFRHPFTKKALRISAPLPRDLDDFIRNQRLVKIDTLTDR